MTPWPHVHVGRMASARAAALLAKAGEALPTYGPVGQTLQNAAVLDLDVSRSLGAGADVFARAVAFVGGLGPQRSIAAVWPVDAEAILGATVLVAVPFGPVTLAALDRIVAVVDEPDRWGYAYGTLPGHPERGEEAFLVTRRPDGEVVMRVMARSRPAVPGGRLLVPVTVPIQRRYAHRYLAATAEATG